MPEGSMRPIFEKISGIEVLHETKNQNPKRSIAIDKIDESIDLTVKASRPWQL